MILALIKRKKLLVTRGQAVRRGQKIALAGATGMASEPQLHFEIREGRRAIDPLERLPARPDPAGSDG